MEIFSPVEIVKTNILAVQDYSVLAGRSIQNVFKQPRYVAVVEELPHTPSHRVAKFKLKQDPTLRQRAVELGIGR